MSVDQAATALPTAPPVTVTAPAPIKAFSEGGDGPTFKDVIDIINPLQHIPVINTIYRHLTGDEEGAVADVGGGALWAGPIGLVGSLVDLAVKAESGKTIGDNILSWLGMGDDDDAASETAKAAETQAQQQVQQQQAQQTAAVTAPLPAIAAQTLAPLPKRGDDRKDGKDKDAPAQVGDYMVFGASAPAAAASGAGQPVSLLPVQSADAADQDAANGPSRQGGYMVFGGGASQQQTPAAVTVSATSTASSADQSTVGHQGDYMVFGVPVPATPATRPVQVAQAAPVPVSAPAPAPVTVQAPAPAAATPAGLTPLPSRTFAAPVRRNQVTPNALPMPTTGPAAVPGHVAQTQAIPSALNQDNASWFTQAMSANLDKYAAAQKLADQSVANSASAAAGAQASADTFATIH